MATLELYRGSSTLPTLLAFTYWENCTGGVVIVVKDLAPAGTGLD